MNLIRVLIISDCFPLKFQGFYAIRQPKQMYMSDISLLLIGVFKIGSAF